MILKVFYGFVLSGALCVSCAFGALPSTNHYLFILFYSGHCPHCRRFAPVLSVYSRMSGFSVLAFTTDGFVLPSFPNSRVISKNVLQTFFGEYAQLAVPALFLLNRENGHAYPISQGALSYSELETRMNVLIPRILRYENRRRDEIIKKN